ncbi:MAG: hypothetical protein LBQ45_02535 [Mycoplasmataceae bacterium]|jgi:predicted SPOUT superfamily RNA methylase MTH1|nr:hypothetical protein [Mycoplasmataceae bacterium]
MNRKPVIIKITKYDKDPNRVGHELEISSHIIGSVKPKKQVKQNKKTTKKPRMTVAKLSGKVDDLSITVEELAGKVDDLSTTVEKLADILMNFMTKQGQFNARIENKLDNIVKLNNLRTE